MKKFAFSIIAVAAVLALGAARASADYIPAGSVAENESSTDSWSSTLVNTTYTSIGAKHGSLATTTSMTEGPTFTYVPHNFEGLAGDTFTFNLSGGGTITFTVNGSVIVTESDDYTASFRGYGYWNESGYLTTPGTFSFSVTDTEGNSGVGDDDTSGGFTFAIPQSPEPSSLVLLGTGLLAGAFLLFLRNRSARAGSVV